MTNESLSQKAYNAILNKIMANAYPPGEIINRRSIAAELGISVAPVLEAMLMLEKDGLLETLPRKGTRVSLIRDTDIAGHFYIREALECFIARQICGDEIIKALPALLTLAKSTDVATNDPLAYHKMDLDFHRSLVALSGMDIVMKEFDRILTVGHFYYINRFVSISETNMHLSHELLIEQLQKDDPEYAYRCMHEHLISGKGHLSIAKK